MSMRRLLVMTYHRVLESPDALIPGQVDARTFAAHLGVLRRFFNVLPLRIALEELWQDNLPARAVAITFDDGYRDNYTVAAPLLTSHGLSATFFLATGYLDGGCMWNDVVIESIRRTRVPHLALAPLGLEDASLESLEAKRAATEGLLKALKYRPIEERASLAKEIARRCEIEVPSDLMMTKREAAALLAEGMDLGAHTVSHPILSRLPDADAAEEIQRGKRELEGITGRSVDLFAYPNGRPMTDFDRRHIDMVERAGFRAAFSTQTGLAERASDRYSLPRTAPWDRHGAKLAVRYLAAHWTGRL
jgi:peptidoglycan/xylan/chitin deacetylase (PgdA/CDA1 family)